MPPFTSHIRMWQLSPLDPNNCWIIRTDLHSLSDPRWKKVCWLSGYVGCCCPRHGWSRDEHHYPRYPRHGWGSLAAPGSQTEKPVSYTPSQTPRYIVHRKSRGIKSTTHPPPCELELTNRFDILDEQDFPPRPGDSHASLGCPGLLALPDRMANPPKSRRPAPSQSSHGRGLDSEMAARPFHLNQPAPPSTLIIGDSVVRNVRMRGAHTLSFPAPRCWKLLKNFPT